MKCGEEEELYVCNDCARAERVRRQKKSQRTRKTPALEPPPPFLEAIMSAVTGLVGEMAAGSSAEAPKKKIVMHDFPLSRIPAAFKVKDSIHLEGLYLIGEVEAVKRSLHALGMELKGLSADGINDSGHVFKVSYSGAPEMAKRVVEDILAQERNARVRLFEEMPRIFGDALCRALAVLKNCRMLSLGELFDLLSPLRLAALEKMLDGIGLKEIEKMIAGIEFSGDDGKVEPRERDRIDSERADEINGRFEDVVLNERAEEKFL